MKREKGTGTSLMVRHQLGGGEASLLYIQKKEGLKKYL